MLYFFPHKFVLTINPNNDKISNKETKYCDKESPPIEFRLKEALNSGKIHNLFPVKICSLFLLYDIFDSIYNLIYFNLQNYFKTNTFRVTEDKQIA